METPLSNNWYTEYTQYMQIHTKLTAINEIFLRLKVPVSQRVE